MRDRLIAGAMTPASLVVKAQKFRRWYRREVLKLFDDVDAILAPATPCTAPLIGQQMFMLDGVELPVRANLGIYTQPISFIGLPVVAVPVPLDPLPIGVQIIAAPWREDVALRLAHALEKKGVVGSDRGRRSNDKCYREECMEIDLPEVVAEVRAAFDRYEKALDDNDVATLDAIFRDDPRTIRYGGAEIFTATPRSKRSAPRALRLGPHDLEDRHQHLRPRPCGCFNAVSPPLLPGKIGRQMQTWVRFPEGWRVVAAHVSMIDA